MDLSILQSKRIGILIPDFDHGGEETRVVFFANHYTEYFKEVYVFAPRGAMLDRLKGDVHFVETAIRSYVHIPGVVKAVRRLGIDFVQGHKRTTFPYLYALERFSGACVNFNFDNIYIDKAWLYRLAPHRLYYLSDHMREHYAPYFKGHKNITINMGGRFYEKVPTWEVAAERQRLGVEGKFVLLSLGRLSDQKNQEMTLRALALAGDASMVCLFAGEGPKEGALRELAAALGLEARVRFLGHRSDVALLLQVADVLVQSSVFEGFPNVFIEAASVELPIITTRVGSYQTLVGPNGISVASNDTEGLSAALKEMKAHYERYAEEAKKLRGSDFFQQFERMRMLENYLQQYAIEAGQEK